ncbi:MAG TPA: TonB-dependent receptor [Allosphingosinicella sp.]|jgi:iron complex outermembrane receptor protein|nr:TonB-dependent receptor [Allosphingosinicella sp.]
MTDKTRAPAAARILLWGCVAALPAPAWAGHEDDIVVTGQKTPGPATVESVDSERLEETTAIITPEDSLRYLPSLFVRKRHVGDTQSPLATRTSGVGASARSLIYADGLLLSALIGNNNTSASPRWGMVSPEEIDRVDVLYGPFSAAYPGNSIGAVVNISTRLPARSEGSISASTSVQSFEQYGSDGIFPAWQVGATLGGREGDFAWFAGASHVDSESQPLAYATVARPANPGAAGTPATGAFADVNRAGAPIFVLGAAGLERHEQDNLKLKLAWEVSPALKLTYRGGLFLNDTEARAKTYLSGNLFAGVLNIAGRTVNVPASAFGNNVYLQDERHWMHGLSAEGEAAGLDWRAVASLYDFDKHEQRLPSGALPGSAGGGPGSIVRLNGTGWRTLDLELRRGGLRGGAHYDGFRLDSRRFATADWREGAPGVLNQLAQGRTRTLALWAEDQFALGNALRLTLGARYEWWRAFNGRNFSLAPALDVAQPEQSAEGLSPKASLRWLPARGLSLTLSAGQAYRFPTVSELYQAISTGPSLTVPDPNLRPERARSAELAGMWTHGSGHVRLSFFHESIRNALISQTAPLVPGSTALFSFVQNVPHVRTSGAELAFQRRGLIVPKLDVSGSVTLARPKVVENPAFPAAEGKDLPQVPRRRATLVATWHATDAASLTLAGRYASRSFGTIDNSDVVTHTYQGFESYLVADARANFRIGEHWNAAFGVENLTNEKYYLFHPFPQRSFTAELTYRW